MGTYTWTRRLGGTLGSPTHRKVHGDGVIVVVVWVTSHHGAWESQREGSQRITSNQKEVDLDESKDLGPTGNPPHIE